MSTASWENNCGINGCLLNSRAVNFETEVIEVNFIVSILDWIWVDFSRHFVPTLFLLLYSFLNLGEPKLGEPHLGEPFF